MIGALVMPLEVWCDGCGRRKPEEQIDPDTHTCTVCRRVDEPSAAALSEYEKRITIVVEKTVEADVTYRDFKTAEEWRQAVKAAESGDWKEASEWVGDDAFSVIDVQVSKPRRPVQVAPVAEGLL